MKRISQPLKPLTPRMQQVVDLVFSPEKLTQAQMGERLGISQSRVKQILQCKRVLATYPVLARRYKSSLIPDAIRAQNEIINQTRDLNVRDKASARLLESEGILDKQPIVIRHELEVLSTDKVIERARDLLKTSGSDVYDAEIIANPTDEVAE